MLRRDMLLATAALPAAAVSFQQGGSGRPKNIVISSANGLAACKRANEILQAGGDTSRPLSRASPSSRTIRKIPASASAVSPMKTASWNSMPV